MPPAAASWAVACLLRYRGRPWWWRRPGGTSRHRGGRASRATERPHNSFLNENWFQGRGRIQMPPVVGQSRAPAALPGAPSQTASRAASPTREQMPRGPWVCRTSGGPSWSCRRRSGSRSERGGLCHFSSEDGGGVLPRGTAPPPKPGQHFLRLLWGLRTREASSSGTVLRAALPAPPMDYVGSSGRLLS